MKNCSYERGLYHVLGLKPTTHLVPRSIMRGAIPPFLHTSSWRGAKLRTREITGDSRNLFGTGANILPMVCHPRTRPPSDSLPSDGVSCPGRLLPYLGTHTSPSLGARFSVLLNLRRFFGQGQGKTRFVPRIRYVYHSLWSMVMEKQFSSNRFKIIWRRY
jgi:hypothetical protein